MTLPPNINTETDVLRTAVVEKRVALVSWNERELFCPPTLHRTLDMLLSVSEPQPQPLGRGGFRDDDRTCGVSARPLLRVGVHRLFFPSGMCQNEVTPFPKPGRLAGQWSLPSRPGASGPATRLLSSAVTGADGGRRAEKTRPLARGPGAQSAFLLPLPSAQKRRSVMQAADGASHLFCPAAKLGGLSPSREPSVRLSRCKRELQSCYGDTPAEKKLHH